MIRVLGLVPKWIGPFFIPKLLVGNSSMVRAGVLYTSDPSSILCRVVYIAGKWNGITMRGS